MVELTPENLQQIATAVSDKLAETADAAAKLGTVSDIWVLIALIMPGFVAFRVITWIAAHDKTYPQFDSTLYFLTLSLGVFFVIHLFDPTIDFSSLDKIRVNATNPEVIAKMIAYGTLVGIVGGLILKFVVLRDKFAGSAWDRFVKLNLGRFVKVYVQHGNDIKVYSGYIKIASTGKDEKKELTLGNPAELATGGGWAYMGPELYIPESVIRGIEKFRVT